MSPSREMRLALHVTSPHGYASLSSLWKKRSCVTVTSGTGSLTDSISSPVALTTSDFTTASPPTDSAMRAFSIFTSPSARGATGSGHLTRP